MNSGQFPEFGKPLSQILELRGEILELGKKLFSNLGKFSWIQALILDWISTDCLINEQ